MTDRLIFRRGYFIKQRYFFFLVCYFYGMFCASSKFEWCGIQEVGSGSFSYVKKDTKSKCKMVVFFIKIYKQVIFQHACIVSPVQSASSKALHCTWHFHRQNLSVLSYMRLDTSLFQAILCSRSYEYMNICTMYIMLEWFIGKHNSRVD